MLSVSEDSSILFQSDHQTDVVVAGWGGLGGCFASYPLVYVLFSGSMVKLFFPGILSPSHDLGEFVNASLYV